jgi:hypothetical protein
MLKIFLIIKQETKKDLNDSGRSLYYKECEKYVKVDRKRSSERKTTYLAIREKEKRLRSK